MANDTGLVNALEPPESVQMLPSTEPLTTHLPLSTNQLHDKGADEKVSDNKMVIPEHLQQVWEWNHEIPASVDQCVHDIIKQRTEAQPNAPAISAWDGELTYGELDRITTGLAGRLLDLGVLPNTIVPLCFEKSMWTTVAILGVLKTGAAFVLLDSSLSERRLLAIAGQAKAHAVICLHSKETLSSRLASHVVTLGPHASTALFNQPEPQLCSSSPSSVMYVAFTSGSTGAPKGALITHRNFASALHHQRDYLRFTAESRVFDFASCSFDVSIYNVFATLAAGGCLCVPNEQDRRDRLAESIASFDADVIDLTPSVARALSPKEVPHLQTIFLGGEALNLRDINPWWGRVRIVSLYGPCECTPNSTINCNPTSPQEATQLGKGVGLVTWVVDPEDHGSLLSLGSVGELLLEGPLVGLGYLNRPENTAAAYIEDPIWLLQGAPGQPGRHGRLYKTGDLVRYNKDGSLTFIGRKDSQVKIRGQRVELGEIEQLLCSHESVDEAVVILLGDEGQDKWLASYVTVRAEDSRFEHHVGSELETQFIAEWADHFNMECYGSMDDIEPQAVGRDFKGWTSMYDGSEIDKKEMNEWLDDTIETILNGSQPGHVLEIGTGSGMILFNLTQGLQSYIGLDQSAKAIEYLSKVVKSVPALTNKVMIIRASADELYGLGMAVSPNLAILNSVIQYFPSQAYLLHIIQQLLRLRGVKTLFFGDVRSYVLQRQLRAMTAWFFTGGQASKDETRHLMARMKDTEAELLVDPAFFTSLPRRLPNQIEHVEILPKMMHATNELSAYRYAAVIHVKVQGRWRQVREIDQDEWIDFVEHELDRQSLSKLLRRASHTSSVVAISNIPHSKSISERYILRSLDQEDETVNDGWLSSAIQEAGRCPSLSAVDLAELATQAGYRVEISWARQFSQSGGLDAIFHRYQTANGEKRVMFRFPDDLGDRPYRSLCSEPLRKATGEYAKEELLEMLKTELPSYMLPERVTILDKLPINTSGKIDRRALAKINSDRTPSFLKPAREPLTETEHQLQKLWGQVLGINHGHIGLNASFFRSGGNSIAAMRLVGEARDAGLELTVANIFAHPQLQDMARLAVPIA